MIVSKSYEPVNIQNDKIVTVTKMNHILEIKSCEVSKKSIEIKKINADEYVDLKTGEIKEFNKSAFKNNIDSIARSMRRLRELINTNFDGSKNELFITLTYEENMTDYKRLYGDFKNFMKKVKRKYKEISKIEYISVVEPQARGAWHCHVLMKFVDVNYIYMDYDTLFGLWKLGKIVQAKRLHEVDNIGAYLSAYLSNMPNNNYDENDKKSKKYIKGARLFFYPSGMNIYRKSKGIKDPEKFKTKYSDIKKEIGNATPNFSMNTLLLDDNDQFINQIKTEQYNLKRN